MLEFLITTTHIIILCSFLIIPILVVRKLKRLQSSFLVLKGIICGLLTCFILSAFSAFWADYSDRMLLRSYNAYVYNPDSGTEQVEYKNVERKNFQKVKELEYSIMGIGWPLKALFLFVFSILPVFILTFIATEIVEPLFSRTKKIISEYSDEKS